MDNDTQKQLDKLTSSWKWSLIGIIVLVLLVLTIFVIWIRREPQDSSAVRIEILTDSMKAHDKQNAILIRQLQMRVVQDSLQYTSIQYQVDRIPGIIASINHKYDLQRNHISNLSDTESVSYFTNWLSKTDSL